MEFLSKEFVMDYVNSKDYPLTELGAFTYTRTYSRWLDQYGRREEWHETVKRAVEYSMGLAYQHKLDNNIEANLPEMYEEAQALFKNIYDTKQFVSGKVLPLSLSR